MRTISALGSVSGLRIVPSRVLAAAAGLSVAGLLVGTVAAWPLWGVTLAALSPWVLVFGRGVAWTQRRFGWLALFSVLAVTQSAHVGEHVAQMIQIHILHRTGAEAPGIFGALDIEWVHMTWNTWILVAVVLLLVRFRRNGWLWATLVIAGWHEAEHVTIMIAYLTTHQAGTPGLLAQGGHIGGGLGITRPDLHFLYNLVETIPLVIGFLWQMRRAFAEPASEPSGAG